MDRGRTLNIGVIGCGNMGRTHTVNCSRIKGVSVVAVVDTDKSKARALGKTVKADVYNSAEKMFASVPLDAVIVATPPQVRWEIVKAAAANGQAPFVEKPIALNLSSAKAC